MGAEDSGRIGKKKKKKLALVISATQSWINLPASITEIYQQTYDHAM